MLSSLVGIVITSCKNSSAASESFAAPFIKDSLPSLECSMILRSEINPLRNHPMVWRCKDQNLKLQLQLYIRLLYLFQNSGDKYTLVIKSPPSITDFADSNVLASDAKFRNGSSSESCITNLISWWSIGNL